MLSYCLVMCSSRLGRLSVQFRVMTYDSPLCYGPHGLTSSLFSILCEINNWKYYSFTLLAKIMMLANKASHVALKYCMKKVCMMKALNIISNCLKITGVNCFLKETKSPIGKKYGWSKNGGSLS